jgi:tRNA/rRNA methyltransferase/tRNA (cytidine32/uridine32-2'-O)-methyltransferase
VLFYGVRLSDFVIVLVRPSEPGNVGAVCRVMMNMGLSSLRLVAPEFAAGSDAAAGAAEFALRARAVHASSIWEAAPIFDELSAAVADCTLVVGTTRRRGHRRKPVTMPPRELAAYLAGRAAEGTQTGKTALIFGNERTGLETSELARCHLASHIDAERVFPSLNLSHAVEIYCYELRSAFPPAPQVFPAGHHEPLSFAEGEDLVRVITGSLESLGFYRYRGREEQETLFRDLIARAALTKTEARYLGDIFAKALRLAKNAGSSAD